MLISDLFGVEGRLRNSKPGINTEATDGFVIAICQILQSLIDERLIIVRSLLAFLRTKLFAFTFQLLMDLFCKRINGSNVFLVHLSEISLS